MSAGVWRSGSSRRLASLASAFDEGVENGHEDQRQQSRRDHAAEDGRAKRLHRRNMDDLPDGAFILRDGEAWALRGGSLLHWTPSGYDARKRRPKKRAYTTVVPNIAPRKDGRAPITGVTNDPLTQTNTLNVFNDGSLTDDTGVLGTPVNLTGIFDLAPLNQALAAAGQPQISS